MLDFLLVPAPVPAPALLEALKQQAGPGQLTAEEVRDLSRLLEHHVQMSEALVEYALAIAGTPRAN